MVQASLSRVLQSDEEKSAFPVIGVQAPSSIVNQSSIRKFSDFDYQKRVDLNHLGEMATKREPVDRRNGVQIVKTRKPVKNKGCGDDDCRSKQGFRKHKTNGFFNSLINWFKNCFYG